MKNSRRNLSTGLIVAVLLATITAVVLFASTMSTTLNPSGTVTGNWTATGGSGGGSCTGHCDFVDEGTTSDGDGSYVQTATATVDEFSLPDTTGGQRATTIKLRVNMRKSVNESCGLGGTPSTNQFLMNIRIGGTLQAQQSFTPSTSYAWYEHEYVGSWTQAQINSLQVWISKTTTGGCFLAANNNATFRASTAQVVVTWQSPDITEEAIRTYSNTNSLTPGIPLAATNSVAEVHNDSQFRVRMALTPSVTTWQTDAWGSYGNTYTLQYAVKSAATCAAQASGWTAVAPGSGQIRWFDNVGVADGATIGAYADDPSTAGAKVYQTYRESNVFGLANTVPVGNAAIWDFALQDVGSPPGATYCLRIVRSDGTTLDAYSAYSEIRIVGDYGVSVVDAGGVDVSNPGVAFPAIQISTSCQNVSATLGVSSQKLRILNDILTGGWDVSIAATNGSGALWDAGSLHYDYNDIAGCMDDADADAYGGALEIDPSSASVTPKAGCTTAGISSGTQATFTETSVDAISLATADTSSERFCYWDMTGILLDQSIPAGTGSGSYTMDMTITMTAQ